MSETIYLVIIEDRHVDVEVRAFRNKDAAIAEAEALVDEWRKDNEYTPDPSDTMRHPSLLYFGVYSSEGDSVRVMEAVAE